MESGAEWYRHSLRFGRRGSRRALTNDFQNGVSVLRTVIVNLLAKVRDEGACGQRNGAVRIKFVPCAHPPSSREDGDKAIIRMKVWMTHVMGSPFDEDDVES